MTYDHALDLHLNGKAYDIDIVKDLINRDELVITDGKVVGLDE